MRNPTCEPIGTMTAVVLAAALLCALPARAQVADPVAATNQVLALMNQERTSRGLAPFTRHCDLDRAAARQADDMAAHNFFPTDHKGSDGSTPDQRIRDTGYPAPMGENLFAGSDSPQVAVETWMKSTAGHREAILDPNRKEVGIAVAYGAGTQYSYYWSLTFGGGGGRACPPTGGATELPTTPALQVQAATLEGSIRSIESVRATSIRFDNVASFPVQIYWLDYEGKRVLYATLAPQESYVQPTYLSHPWLVARSPDAAPLVIFEPTLQPSSARIDGTTTPTTILPIQSPNLDGDVRSRFLSDRATAIEFFNSGPETVQVFWINYDGQRLGYALLQKDKGYRQMSYRGSVWLLADHNGNPLGIVEGTASDGTARFAFAQRP
jgi:uncharacterized protein YkwD